MKTEDKIDDGGPAFPRPASPAEFTDHCQDGLSLLDYFAAKAMAGWLASYSREGDTHPVSNDCADSVARMSYDLARAMVRARAQPEAKCGERLSPDQEQRIIERETM